MANTFLAAQGRNMQKSLVETDKLALARTILEKAESRGVKLVLPVDVKVAESLDATSGTVVKAGAVPEGTMALDVGPETVALIKAELAKAKTVFWNGPMGLFETAAFADGTLEVARALAVIEGFTVVGGGDSAAAIKVAGAEVAEKIDHISTGGGASLELIEGKKLPGVAALETAS
jgi:phosphoglycerate kinase